MTNSNPGATSSTENQQVRTIQDLSLTYNWEAVKRSGLPARMNEILIYNHTNSTLFRQGSPSPEEGEWEVGPPESIHPVGFTGPDGGRIVNISSAAGVKASVTYCLSGCATGINVTFTWSNPLIGANSFTIKADSRIQVRGVDQENNKYPGDESFGKGNKSVTAFEIKLREMRPYLQDFVELDNNAPTFYGAIDAAAFDRSNSDCFWFFKGDRVLKADIVKHSVVESTQLLTEKWPVLAGTDYERDIVAALMATEKVLTLIKANGNVGLLRLDSGTLGQSTVWEQIGTTTKPTGFDTIDAAMFDPDGNHGLYLFSGEQSVRCDVSTGTCESPQATADRWRGLRAVGLSKRVDAAISRSGNKVVHLFHENRYVSLNIETQVFEMDSPDLPVGTGRSVLCKQYINALTSSPYSPESIAYPDLNFYSAQSAQRMGNLVGYLLYGCA